MPKKPKRRLSRGKSAPADLSPAAIERKAQEDLAGGRHREAIAGFKQLLKQEPRPAWRSALADAYAGRARELAAKDMLKEALVIWENRANLGKEIPFDPEHAALLLRIGRIDPMLTFFVSGDPLPPAERGRLRPLLAGAYLSGADIVTERLPADDPVVLHATAARAALTAYCADEDAAFQDALAAIPFRSPYRDWVQILKALRRLPDQPGEAAGLLARVGEESAFHHLRQAAELALLPETSFPEAISGAGKASVRFACTLRGWPPARIALWEEIDRLRIDSRPGALLRFMNQHRAALGADWVRRRGLRLLIADYPASRKQLPALGADPLSEEETLLVAAWDAEHRESPWEEQVTWERYARYLIRKHSEDNPEARQPLRIALALRRCSRVADTQGDAAPPADREELDDSLVSQLEESLTWDPDDRATYLRLICYYRHTKQPKEVRRLLEQARDRWPQDMQVLDASFDTAITAGSFKKAAGFARQMLALDSINSDVRERLVEAHLAHARKQIIKGRPDLARKELAEAGEWARSTHAGTQVDLVAGLLTLIEDAETGAPALRDLVARLGGGLAGHLALVLAGEALALSPQALSKQLKLGKPAADGRDDLLATLAKLRTHMDRDGKITNELGDYASKALIKAPWRDLAKSELETACETLRRCGLSKVRLHVARAALKRWKGEPLFELHAFEAKYPRLYDLVSDDDLHRLETALGRARKEGDTRTMLRIEKVLTAHDPMPFGPAPFGPMADAGPDAPFPDKEVINLMVRTIGLDKTMNMLHLPPELRKMLKKLARQEGTEAAVEMLLTFLKTAISIVDQEMDDLPDPRPRPRPPVRKPAESKGKPSPYLSGADKGQDKDQPHQPDLLG